MVAASLLTRLPFFGHAAVDFDEQLYSLIGAQMRHGLIPYVDLWDRKPIGLFLIFGLAHTLGGDGPVAYQVLGLMACLAGGWQVWRLGCRIADPVTAALGAAVYPVTLALLASHSGQSEVFLVPLILGAALLLMKALDSPLPQARRWCLLAMLVGGLALQVKYTAIAQCLFFGIGALLILHSKGRTLARLGGDAALFAALGVLPTALAAAWYAHRGLLDDFLFANFTSIGLRAPMPWGPNWLDQLPLAIPLLAMAAGGIVAARAHPARSPSAWRMALAWLGASGLGLTTVGTIYYHNFAIAAPAAILVALPLFDLRRRFALPAWLVFFLGMWAGSIFVTKPLAAMDERQEIAGIAAALKRFTGSTGHCLYVFDGPTALYRLTGSGLPSRMIYPDHLNNLLERRALPVDQAAEVARIFAERPGAVVTSPDPVTPQNPQTNALLRAQLAEHYRHIGMWNLRDRRVDAWARLPDADGLAPPCNLH